MTLIHERLPIFRTEIVTIVRISKEQAQSCAMLRYFRHLKGAIS